MPRTSIDILRHCRKHLGLGTIGESISPVPEHLADGLHADVIWLWEHGQLGCAVKNIWLQRLSISTDRR